MTAATATRAATVAAGARSAAPGMSADIDPLTHTPRDLSVDGGYLERASVGAPQQVVLNYVQRTWALSGSPAPTSRPSASASTRSSPASTTWRGPSRRRPLGVRQRPQGARDPGRPRARGPGQPGLRPGRARSPFRAAPSPPGAGHGPRRRWRHGRQRGHRRAPVRAQRRVVNHDFAKRVWFLTPQGLRPGWSTYVSTGRARYQHVIDARPGRCSPPLDRSTRTTATRSSTTTTRAPPRAASPVVNLIDQGGCPRTPPGCTATTSSPGPTSTTTTPSNPTRRRRCPGTRPAQFTLDHVQAPSPSARRVRLHLGPGQAGLLADQHERGRHQRVLPRQQLPRLAGQGADRLHRRSRQLRAAAATRCS